MEQKCNCDCCVKLKEEIKKLKDKLIKAQTENKNLRIFIGDKK